MPKPLEKARAYLDALEADRRVALALSKEKAEEAKLLQARLEGFQAALKMFGRHIPEGVTGTTDRPASVATRAKKRRARRNIPELIAHELSSSGQPITARQIAKAIGYTLEGTETALERMEKDHQVHRGEGDRWA
jgi:hypothetical protein